MVTSCLALSLNTRSLVSTYTTINGFNDDLLFLCLSLVLYLNTIFWERKQRDDFLLWVLKSYSPESDEASTDENKDDEKLEKVALISQPHQLSNPSERKLQFTFFGKVKRILGEMNDTLGIMLPKDWKRHPSMSLRTPESYCGLILVIILKLIKRLLKKLLALG